MTKYFGYILMASFIINLVIIYKYKVKGVIALPIFFISGWVMLIAHKIDEYIN